MAKVKEVSDYFEGTVPSEMKMEFDNVGLLVGIGGAEITKALIALDITGEVIDEARTLGAQLILSHHPLFFELKQIGGDTVNGAKIIKLIQNGISALCLHTNLDQVRGGVNDALAQRLGIVVEGFLSEELVASNSVGYGMGRFGTLSVPMSMGEFLRFVKSALDAPGLRYHDAGIKPVHRVAVCGGTGGNFVEKAFALGCDTLVTADIKHHEFLSAKALGLNLIDGGHFNTENVVVPVLANMLKQGFPELEVIVSSVSDSPVCFFS